MLPISILDLCPVTTDGSESLSLSRSLDLARHAETWGYRRFWLAEHHNMPGIASAARAVVIGHVAGGTSTIRVGAGGVMLPNHAPLVVAEQFGTLAALYPDRIDLGIGRAPGTDQLTAYALRRNLQSNVDDFSRDVAELIHYFGPPEPGQQVRAIPGSGLQVPIWILGSSLYGAQLAAAYGLPYAFASHFAPAMLMQALEAYRSNFSPSEFLDEPYVMLGFNAFAAESDDEGQLLMTSVKQSFLSLRRGRPGRLMPPDDNFDHQLDPGERRMLDSTLACSAVGSPQSIRQSLGEFIDRTQADEIMIASHIFDHSKRLRSFKIVADVARHMNNRNGSRERRPGAPPS